MPLRTKEIRAVTTALFSSAERVDVQISLARQTWFMEVSERFEARRWGISVSRDGVADGVGRLLGERDREECWLLRDELDEASDEEDM